MMSLKLAWRPKVGRMLFSTSTSGRMRLPACQMENMMDVGSRSIFGPDQDAFRDSCRKFFREELRLQHATFEANGIVTKEVWRRLGEVGLLGAAVSADKGGVGASFLEEAVVLEEQAYAHCHAPNIVVHSTIVMPYIERFGTEEQVDKFLPDMTAGCKVGAIAMTEPDAGSDLQGIRTRAVPDGPDHFIINGSKVFFLFL